MAHLRVGELRKNSVFGTQVPGCEPYWYLGYYSPYYKENTIEDVIEALRLIEAATKNPEIDQSLFLRDVMNP